MTTSSTPETPKIEPIPPEGLAWLQQSARVHGATYSQVLLHVLERIELLDQDSIEQSQSNRFCFEAVIKRLEKLEAAQQHDTLLIGGPQDKLDRLIEQDCEDDDKPQTLHTIALKMVDTLEQLQVLPEILDTLRRAIREPMEQPTPEAAPVVTDDGLVRCYAQTVEDALKAGHGINGAAAAGLRAIYNLGRQHGAVPAPVATNEQMREEWARICAMGKETAAAPPAPPPQSSSGWIGPGALPWRPLLPSGCGMGPIHPQPTPNPGPVPPPRQRCKPHDRTHPPHA
jgi:hypothetical protein